MDVLLMDTIPDRPTPYCMWLPHSRVWIDVLHPDYTNAVIEDIVIPLSRIVRFTGQLPFDTPLWRASVLTHLGLCYDIAEGMGISDEKLLRTIFMHDAQEAVVQDVSGPVKLAMREITFDMGHEPVHQSHYDVMETRHEQALAKRFDLLWPQPEIVHKVDRLAFAFEVREHFGEERSRVSEVVENLEEIPAIAQRRRINYRDPEVLVRLAKMLVKD